MSSTTTERPRMERKARRRTFKWGESSLAGIVLSLLGAALILAVATVPLEPLQQALFGVCVAIVFLVAKRFAGKEMTLFLVMLSLAVSLRYMYWRLTETIDFVGPLEMVLGTGLVLAEFYALLTLVLGYIQNIWPLERQPTPMAPDSTTWPTVDVYIPSFNEQLSVVRATVLAAMAIDWPRDKVKIWLLDDGRREEFRQFADACGVGYLTRTSNAHAKAGNLNSAMQQTNGEYIVVFDCDHIPTRAFLQLTMGWMVEQPNLALVQTPHHFYSPDPFQRNLAAGTRVPPESNMFYGLIQDGNDYWNAAFFCGSCAVLRRSALNEIGGFAVETVTEDAHTMLKLHRRGWDSAYLKIPLAAGLATERLALHIGQRVRWARGMLQILRIDNPLFGPGLTWGQRICYLQAMGHFMFALPRIVFLTAPLAYLLMDQNIISASPLAITAFALPHIFHSVATNSRVQRNWRHSFWSEIYETVLALFLVRVTISTLISPRRGKFNVTAKGGLLENGFFDLGAVYPNLILSFLVLAGVIRGIVSLIFLTTEPLVFQALLLNTIWASLSLVVLLAALAVGRETRQVRSRARLSVALPVALHMPDGRVLMATTRDLSQGGASLTADLPEAFVGNIDIDIEFVLGDAPLMVPARVLRWEGKAMQVSWQATTIEEEARVIQAVFGRADVWTDWNAFPVDRPLVSLWRVLTSIRGLFRPRAKQLTPVASKASGGLTGGLAGDAKASQIGARRSAVAGSVAAAVLLLVLTANPLSAQLAVGQGSQTIVRPIPQPVPVLSVSVQGIPTPSVQSNPPLAPARMPQTGSLPALPVPQPVLQPISTNIGSVPANAAPMLVQAGSDQSPRPGTRRLVLTMRQLGAQGPLALRGTSELQGVEFGVRADEVVTGATLNLSGATSPALIPEFSNVTVTLNEQYVGTIPVNREQPSFVMEMPVSPVFFQDLNRLNFRFTGRYAPECNDPLSGLLWSTIYDNSTLTLILERLPPQRDLARLPLPFFDGRVKQLLVLPFIVPAAASNESLKSAGILASWFGNQAAFRGANFPVVNEAPVEGNAVMVVVAGEGRANPALPAITGPTLAVIANPNDPLSSILLVAGRTGDEVVAAATTLTLGSRALGGDMTLAQPATVPARVPYDAPNWIPTNRPVKFGELVDVSDLQSYGYTGLLHVPFRTAPDFYTWRDRAFPMNLLYRAPPGPIIDVAPSRLDVGINGLYLTTFSLAPKETRDSWFSRLLEPGEVHSDVQMKVPAYDVYGYNDLQFYFDAQPLHRGDCVAIPMDLRMSVDPESTIDLSRGYRFAQMPNLQYFVNSGFPFTRMADLSETAVVLPDQPSNVEMTAYLNLMGRLGSLTGYPPVRMAVVRANGINAYPDRDILVMGTIQHMQGTNDLLRNAPLAVQGNRMSVSLPGTLDSVRRIFGDRGHADRQRAATGLQAAVAETTTTMVGAESPMSRGRSVVAILAATPQELEKAVGTMRDGEQSALMQGDLAILSGDRVTSYRVGEGYTVGNLPFWLYPSYYLRDQPYSIMVLMLVGCVLCGAALFWAMRRRANGRLAQTTPTRSVR